MKQTGIESKKSIKRRVQEIKQIIGLSCNFCPDVIS